jgi:hypothetical protein
MCHHTHEDSIIENAYGSHETELECSMQPAGCRVRTPVPHAQTQAAVLRFCELSNTTFGLFKSVTFLDWLNNCQDKTLHKEVRGSNNTTDTRFQDVTTVNEQIRVLHIE